MPRLANTVTVHQLAYTMAVAALGYRVPLRGIETGQNYRIDKCSLK